MFITGCINSNQLSVQSQPPSIIGHWELESNSMILVIFNSDSTFIFTNNNLRSEGTWKIENDKLYQHWEAKYPCLNNNGCDSVADYKLLSDNSLKIRNDDGEILIFKRQDW